MIRISVTLLMVSMALFAHGQSKKELIKKVAELEAKVAAFEAEKAARALDLEDSVQKLSYAIGVNIATGMTQEIGDVSATAFEHAIRDVMADDTKMSREDSEAFMRQQINQIRQEKIELAKAEGVAFMEANKVKPGIETTASGLQYKVLSAGNGPKPTANDRVKVHYTGSLPDGKVFDSSVERGEPAVFGVGQVIAGWTEALQLMPVGAKWKLFIPQELGYGERGAGQDIPPFSPLVFEVELISIEQ